MDIIDRSRLLNEAIEDFNYDEDRPSPTYDFDLTKDKIDKSVEGISDSDDISDYLTLLKDKLKGLDPKIKNKIRKYAITALIGVTSLTAVKQAMNTDVKSNNNPVTATNVITKPDKKFNKFVKPNKVTKRLVDFIKYEEGDVINKGEPVLTTYDLKDGSYTVGWGHAEKKGVSKYKLDQKISRKEAEKLFKEDLKTAKDGVDRVFKEWKQKKIPYNITQGMYESMISLAFNIGVQNFRMTDFIQLVKQGKYDEAKESIPGTHVSYAGHGPRRENEAKMFGEDLPNNLNESNDFDWTEGTKDVLHWVEPDTEERIDLDGEVIYVPVVHGDGEIWVDVSDFNKEEQEKILYNIHEELGFKVYHHFTNRQINNNGTGFLVHCGFEDFDFISQKNHICYFTNTTYNEYKEESPGVKYINGSIFLYDNLNESNDFDWVKDVEIPLVNKIEDVLSGSRYYIDVIDGEGVIKEIKEGDIWEFDPNISYSEFLEELLDTVKFNKENPHYLGGEFDYQTDLYGYFVPEYINESNEFDWVKDVPPKPGVGDCLTHILDVSKRRWHITKYTRSQYGGGMMYELSDGYDRRHIREDVLLSDTQKGILIPCTEDLNESNEFDWVKDIVSYDYPEKLEVLIQHFGYSDVNPEQALESESDYGRLECYDLDNGERWCVGTYDEVELELEDYYRAGAEDGVYDMSSYLTISDDNTEIFIENERNDYIDGNIVYHSDDETNFEEIMEHLGLNTKDTEYTVDDLDELIEMAKDQYESDLRSNIRYYGGLIEYLQNELGFNTKDIEKWFNVDVDIESFVIDMMSWGSWDALFGHETEEITINGITYILLREL